MQKNKENLHNHTTHSDAIVDARVHYTVHKQHTPTHHTQTHPLYKQESIRAYHAGVESTTGIMPETPNSAPTKKLASRTDLYHGDKRFHAKK